MRRVRQQTTDAWKSSIKTGENRPVLRATVERGRVRHEGYTTDYHMGGEFGTRRRAGTFRSIHWGAQHIRELRNLKSINWSRSIDQDVAECTLTLLNTDIVAMGDNSVTIGDEFDSPGLFTFSRGSQRISQNRWGYHEETGWNREIIPDRLVRTYEGYGADDSLPPGEDPHLYPSGVWLIDSVDYNAEGDIVLKMRDVGRLLIDHIVFPPVVPRDDYPLTWSKLRTEQVESRDAAGGSWSQPRGTTRSSNDLYVGKGLVDTPRYVNARGGVQGFYDHYAWRRGSDYEGGRHMWVSTGQSRYWDMVWWEVDLDNVVGGLAALRINCGNGPYKIFISVADSDGWIGKKRIPYEVGTEGIDLGARIKFVKQIRAERRGRFDVTLPRAYANVKKVRLTFTRLRASLPAVNYPYRATLWDLKLYTAPNASDLDFVKGTRSEPIGNYRDFSQIVQWCGAWAGWFWPTDAWLKYEQNGEKHDFGFSSWELPLRSPMPRGRVWGSFQWAGTAGEADITADQFDKQPLMDVIAHVREITGFNFWIAEDGSMVFRMPNLYQLGNYVTPNQADPVRTRRKGRSDEIVILDEEETLTSYETVLSSMNVRERVFVGDTEGKVGAVVRGYRPHGGTGLMRIAGWTDSHWETDRECRVAADMIVARQMFDYRRANVRTPGYPAIQIDDQIRIFERVTNETYYHYVLSVSSELDMEAGTWEYNLETHWLGERPRDAWVMDVEKMEHVTQVYMNTLGTVD